MQKYDIIIIGAGPAGSSCAALLKQKGHSVCVVERSLFPRFSLGESFLPQNMHYFEEAGLIGIFDKFDFQLKNGAEFICGSTKKKIEFEDKTTPGAHLTFQVKRDVFDKLATDEITKQGVEVLFEHEVQEVHFAASDYPVELNLLDLKTRSPVSISSKFIVDASGFAKVLPKKLDLKTEYAKHDRSTYFEHIKTKTPCDFDHNKILITVDEKNRKNWFWTIPFGDNTYSLGITTNEDFKDQNPKEVLDTFITRNPEFKKVLGEFEVTNTPRSISGFSGKTPQKHGEHFVLIGNSGEFLDPVFSSGATVALKSASLAAKTIHKKLNGEAFDWEKDYDLPLNFGLNTFSNFVNAWYTEDLQRIIFSDRIDKKIRGAVISILAGYAWDKTNPYTKHSKRRLKALGEVCGDY